MVIEYTVRSIRAEKDEYRDAHDQKISFQQFWEGEQQSAFVSEFKRFKIEMTIRMHSGRGGTHDFELIALPRSNTIRVLSKDGPNDPDVLFGTLDQRLRRFWSGPKPRQPAVIAKRNGSVEVSVHDATWYAAILHELRLYGPISTGISTWVGVHGPDTRD